MNPCHLMLQDWTMAIHHSTHMHTNTLKYKLCWKTGCFWRVLINEIKLGFFVSVRVCIVSNFANQQEQVDCPHIPPKVSKNSSSKGLLCPQNIHSTTKPFVPKACSVIAGILGGWGEGVLRRCKIDLLNGKLAFNHSSVCLNCIIVWERD